MYSQLSQFMLTATDPPKGCQQTNGKSILKTEGILINDRICSRCMGCLQMMNPGVRIGYYSFNARRIRSINFRVRSI